MNSIRRWRGILVSPMVTDGQKASMDIAFKAGAAPWELKRPNAVFGVRAKGPVRGCLSRRSLSR